MPKVAVLNQKGENVGEIELNDTLFATEIAEQTVYEVVKSQLANKRQGTQSAKTRSDVRGGGRKPFRQKGTGRARQGSIRAPHYRGGGVSFAPKPRSYGYKLAKNIRRKALYSVLTSKLQDNEIIVLDSINLEDYSTKKAKEILDNIKVEGKAYIVTADNDPKVYRSFRNIDKINTTQAQFINVYDLLRYGTLVLTKDAVAKLEEVFI
ncbi:MAG: 50S ribosomal protein L4 [Tissierellia bacterium]|nr:50S ribosomal protein L4 [Tissierellia bacterium]